MALNGVASVSVPESGSKRERDIEPRTFLLGLLLLISCLYSMMARDSYMEDFRAFYLAAVTTHDHLDPYMNQVNVDEKYADGDWDLSDSRFLYPLPSLFFFAPIGHLQYSVSKVVFASVIVLLMAGILVFFYQRYAVTIPILIALFISMPMVANVDKGQIDIVILALLLAAFYLADGWLAGACLGIAIVIKLLPVLAVAWFLGKRRWWTAGWSLVIAGGLTGASIGVWGMERFKEFLQQLAYHTNRMAPHAHDHLLHHQFKTLQVLYGRFVLEGKAAYVFERFYGYEQNPLKHLGRYSSVAGLVVVLGYLGWLFFTKRGRAQSDEGGFFGYLVAALFANSLLWPMGLVACFPMLLLIVFRSRTPAKAGLLMLTPFFLTIGAAANRQFLLWLAAAAFCVWQNMAANESSAEDVVAAKVAA